MEEDFLKEYNESAKKEVIIGDNKEFEGNEISLIIAHAFAVCLIAIVLSGCYIAVMRWAF